MARLKLTDELTKTITDLLAKGHTDRYAFDSVSLSKGSFYKWLARGEAEKARLEENPKSKPKKKEAIFLHFLDRVTRARAAACGVAVDAIRNGMIGTQTVEEYTEITEDTKLGKNGEPYTTTLKRTRRKTIQHPGDWRAGEAYLKRRDPDNWSERQELANPDGTGIFEGLIININDSPTD